MDSLYGTAGNVALWRNEGKIKEIIKVPHGPIDLVIQDKSYANSQVLGKGMGPSFKIMGR